MLLTSVPLHVAAILRWQLNFQDFAANISRGWRPAWPMPPAAATAAAAIAAAVTAGRRRFRWRLRWLWPSGADRCTNPTAAGLQPAPERPLCASPVAVLQPQHTFEQQVLCCLRLRIIERIDLHAERLLQLSSQSSRPHLRPFDHLAATSPVRRATSSSSSSAASEGLKTGHLTHSIQSVGFCVQGFSVVPDTSRTGKNSRVLWCRSDMEGLLPRLVCGSAAAAAAAT